MSFNQKLYNYNWLSHTALVQRGIINFNMVTQPNKLRGINKIYFPYSLSNEK
jgi:putative alpha-1,2-mannosidase